MSSIGRANADWLFQPGTEPRVPSALEARAAAWSEPALKPDRIPEPQDSSRSKTQRAFKKARVWRRKQGATSLVDVVVKIAEICRKHGGEG